MNSTTSYFFGAGASAGSGRLEDRIGIPCIKDLRKGIASMFSYLLQYDLEPITFRVGKGGEVLLTEADILGNRQRLVEIAAFVDEELRTNLSIDTAAKIFYDMDLDHEYLLLKAVLVASFRYWDFFHELDIRYNNFWATLVKSRRKANYASFLGFSGNINILSWNYDNQLEKSLERILAKNPNLNGHRICRDIFEIDIVSNPNVYKLNGSARIDDYVYFDASHHNLPPDLITMWKSKFELASIILHPRVFKSINELCYSWENSPKSIDTVEQAKAKSRDTESLVVIGYSFPTLNHSVDHAIIENMDNLQRIYCQGYDKADSVQIVDACKKVVTKREVEFVPVHTSGFFIPPEVALGSSAGMQ